MRNSHWVNPRFRRLLSDSIIFKALFTESIDPVIGTGSGAFTRAGNQVALNESGNYETYSANNPAWAYDNSANFLGVLGEPASTNSLLQSRDFSTTWADYSGVVGHTQDATGIDGVANTAWTIDDNQGAFYEALYQDVSISNDSNTHTTSIFVKKDSDETRFPAMHVQYRDGTTIDHIVMLNTSSGAISDVSGSADGSSWVENHGNYWRLVVAMANNSTGNTTARIILYPAGGTVIGTLSNAATGTAVFDQAQLELNRSTPTSPIYTTTGTVTRSASVQNPSYTVSDGVNLQQSAGVQIAGFSLNSDLAYWAAYKIIALLSHGESSNHTVLRIESDAKGSDTGKIAAQDVGGTGSTKASVSFSGLTRNTQYKAACRWNATSGKWQVGFYNGSTWSWGTETTYDGDFSYTSLRAFNAGANTDTLVLKNIITYDSDMTTSEIEAAAAAL